MIRRMMARRAFQAGLLLASVALGGVAAAAEPSKSTESRASEAEGTPAPPPVSAPPVARFENGILKFDPLTIQGRVPKPTSIYAGDRKRPAFTDLVPEDSLLPRILESVEEEPF